QLDGLDLEKETNNQNKQKINEFLDNPINTGANYHIAKCLIESWKFWAYHEDEEEFSVYNPIDALKEIVKNAQELQMQEAVEELYEYGVVVLTDIATIIYKMYGAVTNTISSIVNYQTKKFRAYLRKYEIPDNEFDDFDSRKLNWSGLVHRLLQTADDGFDSRSFKDQFLDHLNQLLEVKFNYYNQLTCSTLKT